jgi:MoxR-like ATPase
LDLRTFSETYDRIEQETRRAFLGQEDVLSSVLVAVFAKGHVLIEGVPGVGKTLLVRTLGKVLGCHFRRIQFTPDLMPSDITGQTTYNAQTGKFEFKHGPVFTHVLLADEVNRAPAKTQAAMLEAMQERSVTVDGRTHPLPLPFFVLATQNPIESAGTYPLPEAQLDRFLFKVLIDHPPLPVEEAILRNVRDGFDASDLDAVGMRQIVSPDLVVQMMHAVEAVRIDDKIIHYIATLVSNTRRHRAIQIGASPRAAIALLKTARVEAAVQGRDFVVPDDVKTHGRAVLRHRIILQPDAEIEGVTADEVIESVLHDTPVPGMGEAQRGSGRLAAPPPIASAPPELGSAPTGPAAPATAAAPLPPRPAPSVPPSPPKGVSPLLGGAPAAPRPRVKSSAVPTDVEALDATEPAPSAPSTPAEAPRGGPTPGRPPWERDG